MGFVVSQVPKTGVGAPGWTTGYPPYSWMQNPCFLEVTRRVACKIVQDKELRDVLASVGRFRLTGGAKRAYRDDDLKEDF